MDNMKLIKYFGTAFGVSKLRSIPLYGVFFVRAHYVRASHATSSCLGLYFPRISCSVSFAILRLPFCSFCSLGLSALCSSVGVTSRITSTRPPLMSYLMCAFPYVPLSVLVIVHFSAPCFLYCHFMYNDNSFCSVS